MTKTNMKKEMVRYTTVLPASYVNELKEMVQESFFSSVNQGIRLAVEDFIAAQKKMRYQEKMQEAARDQDFMNRLNETQDAFAEIDREEMSSW